MRVWGLRRAGHRGDGPGGGVVGPRARSIQPGISAPGRLHSRRRSCATILPSREVVFNPTTDVTLGAYADKFLAAFVISGPLNNFRCHLAYRTATTSVHSPSAWALLEGAAYRKAYVITQGSETHAPVGECHQDGGTEEISPNAGHLGALLRLAEAF